MTFFGGIKWFFGFHWELLRKSYSLGDESYIRKFTQADIFKRYLALIVFVSFLRKIFPLIGLPISDGDISFVSNVAFKVYVSAAWGAATAYLVNTIYPRKARIMNSILKLFLLLGLNIFFLGMAVSHIFEGALYLAVGENSAKILHEQEFQALVGAAYLIYTLPAMAINVKRFFALDAVGSLNFALLTPYVFVPISLLFSSALSLSDSLPEEIKEKIDGVWDVLDLFL